MTKVILMFAWFIITIICWLFGTMAKVGDKTSGKDVNIVRSIFFFVEVILTFLVGGYVLN